MKCDYEVPLMVEDVYGDESQRQLFPVMTRGARRDIPDPGGMWRLVTDDAEDYIPHSPYAVEAIKDGDPSVLCEQMRKLMYMRHNSNLQHTPSSTRLTAATLNTVQ